MDAQSDTRLKYLRQRAFILDFLIYAVLMFLFYFMFLALPMMAMGSYDVVQREIYMRWTPIAYVFFFIQHVFLHTVWSGSLGQRFCGLHLYHLAEKPAAKWVFGRALVATLIFPTLILFPGPAIGFYFGPDSGAVSLFALGLGIVITMMLSLRLNKSGQNLQSHCLISSLKK